MKKKYIFLPLLIVFAGIITGCDDYLDKLPDNRAEIDSPEKVIKLLVSAYPEGYPAQIWETMSDNTDENQGNHEGSYGLRDMFYFEEIVSSGTNDGPYDIWNGCYQAIAHANHAIEGIEKLGNPESLNSAMGEALLCRAYGHYLLALTFCNPYSQETRGDLGLPYMLEPETKVNPQYERGTLGELYDKIAEDLEEGLPLIDDNLYTIPKYHFNRKASLAFATRFYIDYRDYDKAIEYANLGLGAMPRASMRDWRTLGNLPPNDEYIMPDAYVDAGSPANLMMISTLTDWGQVANRYYAGGKWFHNLLINSTETFEASGPWGSTQAGSDGTFFFNVFKGGGDFPKAFIRKYARWFQIMDQTTQTGYIRCIFPVFTTEEFLLNRAEAYVLRNESRNDLEKAVEDVNIVMSAIGNSGVLNFSRLTINNIITYYEGLPYYEPTSPTVKKKFNTDRITSEDQEMVMHYVLHIKRLVTAHDGLRWGDMRRYGIDTYRRLGLVDGRNSTLIEHIPYNDKRRTVQIPAEVIGAGLEANPR